MHGCIIQKRFCIILIHDFGYLIDKKAKKWRIQKSLHSVDLRPNSGTLGHFQSWQLHLSFLKHNKVQYEHGCQNVLKMITDFFRLFFDGQLLVFIVLKFEMKFNLNILHLFFSV